jgi:hypothetical protein
LKAFSYTPIAGSSPFRSGRSGVAAAHNAWDQRCRCPIESSLFTSDIPTARNRLLSEYHARRRKSRRWPQLVLRARWRVLSSADRCRFVEADTCPLTRWARPHRRRQKESCPSVPTRIWTLAANGRFALRHCRAKHPRASFSPCDACGMRRPRRCPGLPRCAFNSNRSHVVRGSALDARSVCLALSTSLPLPIGLWEAPPPFGVPVGAAYLPITALQSPQPGRLPGGPDAPRRRTRRRPDSP